MHPSLIIVDDCLESPESVREKILRQEFILHKPDAGSGYSYRETCPASELVQEMLNRVEDILGRNVASTYSDSKIVAENKRDERISKKRTWIHYDPFRWTAVLYLNLPEQCRGGTGFYRHKRTGFSNLLEVRHDFTNGGKLNRLVSRDSANPSAWELTDRVQMVFNRMVLFDGRSFHQALEYFGDSLRSSRMFMQMTFQRVDDQLIRKET
jgi:hypothetical protein